MKLLTRGKNLLLIDVHKSQLSFSLKNWDAQARLGSQPAQLSSAWEISARTHLVCSSECTYILQQKVATKSRPSNLQQPKHLLRVDLASPTYAPFIVGLNGVFYSRPVEILQDAKSEHLLRVQKIELNKTKKSDANTWRGFPEIDPARLHTYMLK